MPIAFEMSTDNRIERPGLRHGISCGSAYDSPESVPAGDRQLTAASKAASGHRGEQALDTSSSSSIGRDSDSESDGDGGCGDDEVQSGYKGPLDCLDALEEVLPMKKGISKFYNGKSKSFTSLADAVSCSSIKEIVKPENAFTRKRKNLIAHSTLWEKNCKFPPRNNSGTISKRPTNSIRTTSTGSSSQSNDSDSCNLNALSPVFSLPPLHPQSRRSSNNEPSFSPPGRNFSPWRSFSLSDLQGAAAVTPITTATAINKGE